MGPESSKELVDMGQRQTEAALDYACADADLLSISLNAMLADKHVVHVS
jgi:hypothetical protein